MAHWLGRTEFCCLALGNIMSWPPPLTQLYRPRVALASSCCHMPHKAAVLPVFTPQSLRTSLLHLPLLVWRWFLLAKTERDGSKFLSVFF